MEDDLTILKVEYLSNCWLDLPQILNWEYGDQTKIDNVLKWRQPPMEDDLNIFQVEYLSINHWLDLPQILDLHLGDQIKIKNFLKWRWPPVEATSK